MVFSLESSESTEIIDNLRQAPNINSAVKGFLKREVKKGDGAERFIKDLRDALLAKNPQPAAEYLSRKLQAFEPYVVALGGYAHAEFVTALAGEIVEKYADEFNATYEVQADTIRLKDEKKFNSIVGEALQHISGEIEKRGLSSYFMKCVVLNAIFDRPVLVKVLEQVRD